MERVLSDKAQGWDKWQEEADRALRTTDSWEVGGPGPSRAVPLPPPAPLCAGPGVLAPAGNQGEQGAEGAGSSDLAAGGGLNGRRLLHGSHRRSPRPRDPGGAPRDM